MNDQPVPNPLASNPNFNTHKVFATIGLILITAIIILGGIWWYVESQDKAPAIDNGTKVATSSANNQNQITLCVPNSPLIAQVKGVVEKYVSGTTVVPPEGNKTEEGPVQWLRAKGEPYISYDGRYLSYMELGEFTSEELQQKLKSDLDKFLAPYGLKPNSLNSEKLDFGNVVFYTLGYDNPKLTNSEIVTVRIDPDNKDNIEVRCATKSSKYDDFYSGIIKSGLVTGYLEDKGGAWQIWESNDKSVELALGSIDPHALGMSNVWLTQQNGIWKKVAEGQQTPECTVLEAANFGPGIDCHDPAANTSTEIRQTK